MTALPHDSARAFEPGAGLRRAAPTRPHSRQRRRSRSVAVHPLTSLSTRAFFALVGLALALGLAAMLMVNTMLAQGSLDRYELMVRKSSVIAEEQSVTAQLAQFGTPRALSERATALGMVNNAHPAFIDLRTGEILGEPMPAAPHDASRDVLGVRPMAPTDDDGGEVAVGLAPVESTR